MIISLFITIKKIKEFEKEWKKEIWKDSNEGHEIKEFEKVR